LTTTAAAAAAADIIPTPSVAATLTSAMTVAVGASSWASNAALPLVPLQRAARMFSIGSPPPPQALPVSRRHYAAAEEKPMTSSGAPRSHKMAPDFPPPPLLHHPHESAASLLTYSALMAHMRERAGTGSSSPPSMFPPSCRRHQPQQSD
jgi:hypothetical protein